MFTFQKQPNSGWALWKFSHPWSQTDKNEGKLHEDSLEDRLHMIQYLQHSRTHNTRQCVVTEYLNMRQTAAKLCSICSMTTRNKTDILFTRTYQIKPKGQTHSFWVHNRINCVYTYCPERDNNLRILWRIKLNHRWCLTVSQNGNCFQQQEACQVRYWDLR
jgi:hypothetical protein